MAWGPVCLIQQNSTGLCSWQKLFLKMFQKFIFKFQFIYTPLNSYIPTFRMASNILIINRYNQENIKIFIIKVSFQDRMITQQADGKFERQGLWWQTNVYHLREGQDEIWNACCLNPKPDGKAQLYRPCKTIIGPAGLWSSVGVYILFDCLWAWLGVVGGPCLTLM